MDDRHRIEPDEPIDRLLDRVERGEEVVISRDGKPVARLIASSPAVDRTEAVQAMHRIREMSKGVTLGGLSIVEMIREGRRY